MTTPFQNFINVLQFVIHHAPDFSISEGAINTQILQCPW